MKIDGPFRFKPSGPDKSRNRPARAGKASEAAPGEVAGVDPQIRADLQPYVQRLQAVDDVNADAVRDARALLADGSLDTPEAIRRVAEKLADFGL